MTPTIFYDTECYPNFWLLRMRMEGESFRFILYAGQSLSDEDRSQISTLFRIFLCVSFNGNHYDVPMICAALHGYTCEQLKWLNDEIIVRQQKPWQLGLPDWKPADHIDLFEVMPGAGSQKLYAGRIHSKRMQDLPYSPDNLLTPEQMIEVDDYCGNDLDVLEDEYRAARPMLEQRIELSKRYGIDLRSKSDAQLAEAVLKLRCEQALGRRIYKPEIDWNLSFRYEPPTFLQFSTPSLLSAFETIKAAIFRLGGKGSVEMPFELRGLAISIGTSVYRIGIGGLHSSEQRKVYKSNATHVLRDIDVASYYPNLILNSGRFPQALGPTFLTEYEAIKNERLAAKRLETKIKNDPKYQNWVTGDLSKKAVQPYYTHPDWIKAHNENEGGKIQINGTFGKTGSPYSVLFAPEMLIQTTVTGQLAILMLIEWFEHYGISVVSANTDGIVIYPERSKLHIADHLVKEWEKRTGLEMEATEYAALYSRDVNNYCAVKANGEVKRKGEYSKAGLIEKKNPDSEICSDAVAEYLSKGIPVFATIASCDDIRKFVVVQRVTGGAVKMWGEGPRKDALVRDMIPVLEANGWIKVGRLWNHFDHPERDTFTAQAAYELCFQPQRPEYIGKVVRWYYSTNAPGPIVYANDNKTVSLSYGAKPCMILPDSLPADIDYAWYTANAKRMLREMGAIE